ncbi:hypothetical protein GCM10010276_88310 [Streptomyces longisporus]|uniref:Uncharacterized protein n=1 Tax=Streptomyces longisporus TaxID=1948 RepID=A0ABP6ATW4_STRLO
MSPRHSRPEGAVERLAAAVREAEKERDQEITAAQEKFWSRMAELKNAYRGAQTDMADVLGLTRDAILKGIKSNVRDAAHR